MIPDDATLRPSAIIDRDHPAVQAFARTHTAGASDAVQRAVRLYDAVRDGIYYDPYRIDLSVEGLSASRALSQGYGWCVTKAVLLAAVCRAVGIPARIGLADVRNHLSTERLRTAMGTDIFYGHGYTSLWLQGRWVKATPAFNLSLCVKFGLYPLRFDGSTDSIYHPYDLEGRRHMEYVRMHGEFDDLPRDFLLALFAEHYSHLSGLVRADWERDVRLETADSSAATAAGTGSGREPAAVDAHVDTEHPTKR
jgi:transglutaminase-like putative cysteine protease